MLKTHDITKRFGALVANDSVSLEIKSGEMHALVGENGAGKSTFVKMLYGALQADSGTIEWDGKPVQIANPAAARALGIGMVFQHFSLFDALTVAENIALALPSSFGLAKVRAELESLSASYGLPLNPDGRIADLSVGERQRVEIIRCLMQNPKLIIMDEPTSVLTPQEADELFVVLERLVEEGRSILYISHKLDEVRRLCSSATILRHGKVVATCNPREKSKAELAEMMVGESVGAVISDQSADDLMKRAAVLVLDELSLPAPHVFGTSLKDVSMRLHGGRVAAIAGIAGNGQDELFNALSGETLVVESDVMMFGEPIGDTGIAERRRRGAAFISEERLGHGAAPDFSLSDNVLLSRGASDSSLRRGSFILGNVATEIRERVCAAFDVRRGSDNPPARALSGGNLQKFVVGREVDWDPKIIIVNQPTWGVDAGAARHIRQTLIDRARAGAAVLVISQDLDEIFEIADDIAVLSEGHLSEFVAKGDTDRNAIGLLMGGDAASSDTSSSQAEEANVA